MAEKYPVVLTEVGYCGPDNRGAHIPVISDASYVEKIIAYCKKKGMSYCVWIFDPEWSPMLIEDWTFKPTVSGEVSKKAMLEE